MSPTPVIEATNLRKTYGQTVAVDDDTFETREGAIFGRSGPNVAGTTTTMECVGGLRKRGGGTGAVLSLDPWKDCDERQNRVGVQLQQAQLQKRIKVWEAVDLWASLYPRTVDGDALLEQLGLADKRDAWFMTLSGGQKQRLFIALALIHDPDLVFLDELTTGLDPQARRAIWDLVQSIKARGKTVFLTTHLMEEAERLCDRVAVIEHGRIIAMDTPAGLVRHHCPERSAVFSTDGTVDGSIFERIPQITTVDSDGSHFTLTGRGDDFISDVIHAISEASVRVRDFRTETPNLEDVFLKLTGHSIRD